MRPDRFRLIFAIGAAALAFPASAPAQIPGSGASMSGVRQGRIQEQFDLHRLDTMTAEWRRTHTRARTRLAERAALLINQGDCSAARNLAGSHNDQLMVYRIDQACAQFEVTAPVDAPPRTDTR